jgi:1-acyl-sn-glycerol-3-phosphate acyltransferase
MILERARQTLRTGAFLGITGAMLPLFIARKRVGDASDELRVRDRWVRAYMKALLAVFDVKVHVSGAFQPNGTSAPTGARGTLVVVNHRSALDIAIVLSLFGGRMVSRHDVASWPLLGRAAKEVGTVFVDRTASKSGMMAMRAMTKLLQQGETVCIFPEGTTFAGDDVRPFHAGGFVSAVGSDAVVVPVGVAYSSRSDAAYLNETFPAHLARVSRSGTTHVAVAVGEPIVTSGMRARDLERVTHAAVQDRVNDARRSVDRF